MKNVLLFRRLVEASQSQSGVQNMIITFWPVYSRGEGVTVHLAILFDMIRPGHS